MIRAVVFALLASILAACGAMETATGIPDPFGTPQPFQGSGDQRIIGGVLAERSVYIGAIQGMDEAAATSLRRAIANAAGALDVLASANTPPAESLTLNGKARNGAVDFTLFDGTSPLTTFTASGEPALIAVNAAQSLASALGRLGSAPPGAATAGAASGATIRRVPTIFVAGIAGPSADKTEPLRRAIVAGLAGMGAKMVDAKSEESYVVTGVLGFGSDMQGKTAVSIVWTVISPGGVNLGQAAQDNVLPTEAVKAKWAESASLAGGAAANSVAQIIASDFNKKPPS